VWSKLSHLGGYTLHGEFEVSIVVTVVELYVYNPGKKYPDVLARVG